MATTGIDPNASLGGLSQGFQQGIQNPDGSWSYPNSTGSYNGSNVDTNINPNIGYMTNNNAGSMNVGQTQNQTSSSNTGGQAIASNASLGDKIRAYYGQGYSGPQVAAALQQSGVSAQQAADATGIPVDTWNQAFGGASQYSGGIGSPAGNPGTPVQQPAQQTQANPWGLSTANTNAFNTSTNPYINAAQSTALGNYQGATAATAANRVNQNTPYGSLQYSQTGTDANGNPIWSANQTLSPQLQALTTQSLTGLQNSLTNPAYGINPGQTYSDAIMQRLQPQQAHAQEQQAASLANQGIMPGSDAYNNAMRTFNQGQNDQLTSAITGGMNVGLQANTAQNQTAANIKSLSNPNYVNPYTQAAVSGPDYSGAYTTSQNAAIAAQNAANAKTANLQSGLFGLGSTALLGNGGLTGLANLGAGAYNGLSNLFSNNSTNANLYSDVSQIPTSAWSSGAF